MDNNKNNNNNDKSLILIKSNNIYDFKDYIDMDIFQRISNNIYNACNDLFIIDDNTKLSKIDKMSNNQFKFYLNKFYMDFIYPEFNNINDNLLSYEFSIYELYVLKIIFCSICNLCNKKVSLMNYATFIGKLPNYFDDFILQEFNYLVELDSYGNNVNILKIKLCESLNSACEEYYTNILTDNKSPLAPISVVNRYFDWGRKSGYIQDNNTIDTTNTSIYLERLKQEANN